MEVKKVISALVKWEKEHIAKQKHYLSNVKKLSYNENYRSVKVGVDNARIDLDLLMRYTEAVKLITDNRRTLETYVLTAERGEGDKGMQDRLKDFNNKMINYLRENKRIK